MRTLRIPGPPFSTVALPFLVAGVLACGCAAGLPPEGGPRVSVEAAPLWGPASGYTQVPRGGNYGSSSRERPTLEEIGIDDVFGGTAAVRLEAGRQALEFSATFYPMSGSSRLDEELVSHNVTYPAGTSVDAEVDLARWELTWGPGIYGPAGAGDGPRWTVRPTFGLLLGSFDYDLTASGGLRSPRSYSSVTGRFGVECEYRAAGRLTLDAGLRAGIPGPNLSVLSARARARWGLGSGPRRAWEAWLGVGWERGEFEDGQDFPNHTLTEIGPILTLGLTGSF